MKTNILFIGNSYTYYNEMPDILEKLAKENGKDVRVFSVTCGGHKLWEYAHGDDEYTAKIDELIKKTEMEIQEAPTPEETTFNIGKLSALVDYRSSKHKKIIESDNLFADSACCFTTSRCLFFEPVGNEGLCPNTKCAYWKRNNQYYQNLCQVKELKQKIDNFWTDKYANVK